MVHYDSNKFLLQKGDGGGIEVFTDVASLTDVSISGGLSPVDVSSKSDNGNPNLLDGTGKISFSVSGGGRANDSVNMAALRTDFLARSAGNYRIINTASGKYYAGSFMIDSFDESGAQDDALAFTINLSAASAITFV